MIKKIVKKTIIHDIYRYLKKINTIKKWEKAGKPLPPPHQIKQEIIIKYAKKYSIDTFIETGTYHGRMVYAVRKKFKKIYSIELSEKLFKAAKEKFKNYKNIEIIQGDSGEKISEILKNINNDCLFWLDGHYSAGITAKGEKETPILKELKHIFKHSVKKHIILIDDARCFTGEGDYPTMENLTKYINNFGEYNIKIKNDIIRINLKK